VEDVWTAFELVHGQELELEGAQLSDTNLSQRS